MQWPGPVIEVKLIKRYKRFLADFLLSDGTKVTGHCANTGSMKTCMADHAPCWITFHDDPKRKLKYSWQAIRLDDGWVGINTSLANHLVREAIESGVLQEFSAYTSIKPEQKYGENSRIDLLLKGDELPDCYVEVKNVTLLMSEGVVGFPDAVTQRGTKHLGEMEHLVRSGKRAILCYCVQRTSAARVMPAEDYDPTYAAALRSAVASGVEVVALRAEMSKEGVYLKDRLPIEL